MSYKLQDLIDVISGMGLKNLKDIKAQKQIKKMEEEHRTILQTALDGFWKRQGVQP